MGEPRSPNRVPDADVFAIDELDDEAPDVDETGKDPLVSSNNWAVSGALTPNGQRTGVE